MTHDSLLAELFLEALGEAKRNAQSLSSSLRRLAGALPFSAGSLASLDDDAKDRVDAFCLRFLKLQDTLGKPVFRSLLALELEDPENLSQFLPSHCASCGEYVEALAAKSATCRGSQA